MVNCPDCGEDYTQLSQHWRLSSCSTPDLTDRQIEILTGLMLGDGRLVRKDGRKPYFSVSNTAKNFLEWFDNEMGVLGQGVRKHGEPEEEHHSQPYTCSTRSHEGLSRFTKWYDSDVDVISEVDLTPLVAKCWYVSDGTILKPDKKRPTARITSRKTDEKKEKMRKLFVEQGFSPTWSNTQLFFDAGDTEKLLEWMGEPLPGFQYKFPDPPELDKTYSAPEKRQWTDKNEFERLRYEEEMSYADMANKWDCSTATVHKWDRKHGFV